MREKGKKKIRHVSILICDVMRCERDVIKSLYLFIRRSSGRQQRNNQNITQAQAQHKDNTTINKNRGKFETRPIIDRVCVCVGR